MLKERRGQAQKMKPRGKKVAHGKRTAMETSDDDDDDSEDDAGTSSSAVTDAHQVDANADSED